MRKFKHILLIILIVLVTSRTKAQDLNGVHFQETGSSVSAENDLTRIVFNLKTGSYQVISKIDRTVCIDSAYAQVNEWKTTDPGLRKWQLLDDKDGASLLISQEIPNQPTLLLKFSMKQGKPYVLFTTGINNTTNQAIAVKKLAPLCDAHIFRGENIMENLKVLDGNGGGEGTIIREKPALLSRNNLMFTFGNDRIRHSLVMGGISYNEYEKFAQIGSLSTRREELKDQDVNDMRLLTYIDLGAEEQTKQVGREPEIKVLKGKGYVFDDQLTYPEANSVVWDEKEIEIEISILDKDKLYSVGLVWCDDGSGRTQSVSVQDGDNVNSRNEVIASKSLPNLNKAEKPEVAYFRIPKEMSEKGSVRIIVKNEGGINTVASELIVYEGKVYTDHWGKVFPVETMTRLQKEPSINLYAKDAVGKRVDPGVSYLPEKDRFYLDCSTTDPFESLELYGKTLASEQHVKVNYYYFPTICLWYAMEPRYGGIGTLATNDSPGAVEEMQRVKDSGWLKYTTMAIRLVPDCYADVNENGWWDDAHWQLHGSGKQHPGMKLKSAHYRPPYETTEKWAGTVTRLGGIPLIYFQTAVRSKDYAEKYPEQMLYNESYHQVGNWDYFNQGYSTYDFTDGAFAKHMQEVYSNLRKAGVRGLMYDYTYTGWADYGGMDDKYATSGSHYLRIFQLAKEGLGNDCYLHERNLDRGSDITLGTVASQRIWGDTDIATPEMISRGGLRWYKNRTVICYDMDAKNLIKVSPNNQDGLQKMLTMSYVAGSRLLLANSFCMLNAQQIHTLSRVFPFHQTTLSARPIDMLQSSLPKIYDFKITPEWHQLALYNQNDSLPDDFKIRLSSKVTSGGLGLDPSKSYYIYDFWNDTFVGNYKGSASLMQTLRPGEARMLSVREVKSFPQIVSTDRHLMQGYIELSGISWEPEHHILSGTAQLIENEPMKIVVANNNFHVKQVKSDQAISTMQVKDGFTEITLTSKTGQSVQWSLIF